jgi:hypothetical protein
MADSVSQGPSTPEQELPCTVSFSCGTHPLGLWVCLRPEIRPCSLPSGRSVLA